MSVCIWNTSSCPRYTECSTHAVILILFVSLRDGVHKRQENTIWFKNKCGQGYFFSIPSFYYFSWHSCSAVGQEKALLSCFFMDPIFSFFQKTGSTINWQLNHSLMPWVFLFFIFLPELQTSNLFATLFAPHRQNCQSTFLNKAEL